MIHLVDSNMEAFKNDKGQHVGELKNGIFRRQVHGSKHLMKIYDAWGMDESIAQELFGKCEEIRILDVEELIVYSVQFETFMQHGFIKDFGNEQRFLPRKQWETKQFKY